MAQQERFELYLIRGIAREKRILCSLVCSCARILKILLHFLLGGFDGVLPDVGIDIHRRGELGVAEKGLHCLKVNAALVKRSGVPVADLMSGYSDTRLLLISLVSIVIVVIGQRLTIGLGKDVALGQLLGEKLVERGQKRHLAYALLTFWWFDLRMVANVVHGFGNADPLCLAVDVRAGEGQRLTASATGIIDQRGKQPKRRILGANLDKFDLAVIRRHTATCLETFGNAQHLGRIVRQRALHNGKAQNLPDDLQLRRDRFASARHRELANVSIDHLRENL